MPTDGDFKHLVRSRMEQTGERYTVARVALQRERVTADPAVTDRARSLLGQLADVELANRTHAHLAGLPEEERRAVALEGLRHDNWRVRRTCAQLLDRVDLTPETVAALIRALDDEHPQVRRKAIHTLTCEHCKPNGCVADVQPLFERAVQDSSVIVRSMVVHVCSLHFFDQQWAVDLVASVAASDPSAKLRQASAAEVERLQQQWESDAHRRGLAPALVAKTDRHAGRWIAIRDNRIVAVNNGQARVFRREVLAGATPYWVAPASASRPRIP